MSRKIITKPHAHTPESHHSGNDVPKEHKPGTGLALPHERDESVNSTDESPDPMMVQAKRDIDAGLVDTDMHATPGLDAQTRERMVPGPGGKPPAAGHQGFDVES